MNNPNSASVHRGVCYAVKNIGNSVWQWEIYPPHEAVKGLRFETGKVSGESKDAVRAAKQAIDSQQFALW